MADAYQTEQEIEAVVNGFENCTIAPDRFRHREHLTVATFYLLNSTPDHALARMRASLHRFLDQHGVARGKYDEEVTRNWLALVQQVIGRPGAETSWLAITNRVIGELGAGKLSRPQDAEVTSRRF